MYNASYLNEIRYVCSCRDKVLLNTKYADYLATTNFFRRQIKKKYEEDINLILHLHAFNIL